MTPGPRRLILRLAGLLCILIGLVGVVVPLLPTTPFLLLALLCWARAWPEAAARLLDHPRWGPPVRAWQRGEALPKRVLVSALVVLWLSCGTTAWWMWSRHHACAAGILAMATGVSLWLVLRGGRSVR